MQHIVVCVLLSGSMYSPLRSAQAQIPGLKEWAESTSQAASPKWKGPRVNFPALRTIAADMRTTHSVVYPVAVIHSKDIDSLLVHQAMQALEYSYVSFESAGWRPNYPSVTTHAVTGFSLVLDDKAEQPASASTDGQVLWSALDSASAFAVVNPTLCGPSLLACVQQAYAEALLLAMDPAEHEHWRRSTALYLAGLFSWNALDRSYTLDEQSKPEKPLGPHFEEPSSSAFLRWIATRWNRDGARVVHELWDFTQQQTWEGERLRASPDLWMCLEQMAKSKKEDLSSLIEEYSASRGLQAAQHQGTGGVPAIPTYGYDALPKHVAPFDPALSPLGSQFVLVDTKTLDKPGTLKIWLEGEFGVRWSLSATKLDSKGNDIGRVTMPYQKTPKGYLAVELQPGTSAILVTVTNLSEGLPDADTPSELVRTARLIIGK